MYYYRGEIKTLLDNIYLFFKSVGFDTYVIDGVIFCRFKPISGIVNIWEYSIGYDYCSDIDEYKETLRTISTSQNDIEKSIIIYKLDGSIDQRRLIFNDNQWIEMILALMIPSFSYRELLSQFKIEIEKYTIDPEFGGKGDIYDISKYIRAAREIKLNILLND